MTVTAFTEDNIDIDAEKSRTDWWLITVGAVGFAVALMGAIFAEPDTAAHDAGYASAATEFAAGDHADDHAPAKAAVSDHH
ncbi:hypothetical protein [Poseidonocella sedimentorum]|uniref:Uncharacterized protein n=1 Tax=Poseidonocella sedimentorum TaxID=871652 RepID=A0A1I6CPF9_9RHOB|nr:hypothetical protein [Poseidonocella sedimentorum]SFQ95048.1 hypothetical protein SAMN04515673_101144 [Poseidonocella sedimentorum]